MSTALAVVTPMAVSITEEKKAWDLMRDQAAILITTGFLPEAIKTPEQAIHIMMKGRELGIPATYALSNVAIVKGKPSCSAELMLALIRRDHGPQSIRVKASSNQACTVEWRTPGWDGTQTYTFTIDDAKQADLVQPRSNWTKYPAAMLRARCISAVARMAFPESIAGMYSPGELGEAVTVTDDGEVISSGGAVLGEIVDYDPGLGSERVTEPTFIPASPPVPTDAPPVEPVRVADPMAPITERQTKMIWATAREKGLSEAEVHALAAVDHVTDLFRGQASDFIKLLVEEQAGTLKQMAARAMGQEELPMDPPPSARVAPWEEHPGDGTPELIDWTTFWKWARPEGFANKTQIEALIGRPLAPLTPEQAKRAILAAKAREQAS